jgi:A1 cistron-splicing factor AAR2
MSRCGYWFVTGSEGPRGRVRAKQWDRFDEALVQPAGVAGLSPRLVPYGYAGDEDAARLWPRLTSAIGEKLLGRVTAARPARGGDGDDDDAPEWPVDTSDSASGDGLGPGGLDFLFPEGDVDLAAIGHDTDTTTTNPPDTTTSILRLVDHPGTGVTGADIVGEVQFAFLTGLHLSSLSCVGQWWHLVLRVVLRAHGLALARPALARALIQTLHAQMVYNERYIAGGPDGTATTTTTTTAATTTTGGDGDGEEGDEGSEYAQQQQQQQQQQQERVRHEYGGADAQGTSILDIVPGNKRRLREALALFKRRLDEALSAGGPVVTDEHRAVGRAFSDLEAWFWRFGWDLRMDAAGGRRKGAGDESDEDDDGYDDDDDDGDYQPVIVDLDENGREVGLVSFN